MHKVLERLLVGELSEANDPFFLSHHRIQAILYFGEGGMFGDEIKLYHHRAQADGSLDPRQLADGIEFLRESLRAGRRVLAVGPTGSTIVAAYLMEMGFSRAQAVEQVMRGRVPTPDARRVEGHAAELERRSSVSVHVGGVRG